MGRKRNVIRMLVIGLILLILLNMTVFAAGESGAIMSAGDQNSYVIKTDGSLWGWGGHYSGNGTGHREPTVTPEKILDNVKSVSSATFSTVAVKKDNTLWAWGRFDGYLNGSQDPTYLTPTQILDDVILAAAGDGYILALKSDNSLWLAGDMYIGDGTLTKADTETGFVQVMSDVKSMHAGSDTVFVIKNDDTLWGWGDNADAQLGNLTDVGDTNTDVELTATFILDDVRSVSNRGELVIAVRLDNSLYSWGTGGSNGIYTEDGWIKSVGSPYKVMDDVLMGTMTSNGSGVLIVKTDGTLWGWGNQWNNEGTPTTPYKYADNVLSVSNGERHAVVVKKDGTLWTMGGNYRYGLGYNSDETWYTPLTKVISNVQDAPVSWAEKEVEEAIGRLLIPENLQNNYGQSITREEFCTLAIRMIEVKSGMAIDDYMAVRGLTMAPSDTFTDTNNPDILAAKTLGITDGTSPTTFDPTKQLTREQAAKFLSATARSVGKEIEATVPNYVDINDIANWAKPYIGYVYNISVMKGVGGNKFDPKGSYQRQQAFMTMNRLFDSIEAVSTEMIQSETPVQVTGVSRGNIEERINSTPEPSFIYMTLEGTTLSSGVETPISYELFYHDRNVRIETSWDDRLIGKSIYNKAKDMTYTELMMGTSYGELLSGNYLPIEILNVEYAEQLEINSDEETYTAEFQMLEGQEVLYVKTTLKDGNSSERWFSLEHFLPVKYCEVSFEDGYKDITQWEMTYLDDSPFETAEIFDIPESAVFSDKTVDDNALREILIKDLDRMDIDEKGIDDMTTIFYYSNTSYDDLVLYFTGILEGTEGYVLSSGDEKTSIDGTINGYSIIIIINNYMKYEPAAGGNGINVNYYKW